MKATKNIQQSQPIDQQLDALKASMHQEMQSLLDWWMQNMIDEENGGFYGRIDGRGNLHATADKGVILNTRILWTFAIAAREQDSVTYKNIANRAWRYISEHFIDTLEGGVFWMLDHKGEPTQTKKQVYAQAFAVYAFTEYYRLTGNKRALDHAMEIFFLMERYSFDKKKGGYLEAFSRGWRVLEDVRLSQKDDNAVKTMNTHLHVLEAYTNLYRVHADKTVGKALQSLIECFLERFIDTDSYHLLLFFDEDWNSQSTMLSYGHDIEASWLLVEAAEVLQHEPLINKCKQLAVRMGETTLAEGIDLDGGCFYETIPGKHADHDKHWWPQAEAVVGFLNAYQISGDHKFFEAAQKSWAFILEHIKDVEGGEWHWMVSRDHQVAYEEDKAGPWKGPYHNVRACMEGMTRLSLNL